MLMPRVDLVVLGASSGGVEAVCTLLEQLPATIEVPLVMALHVLATRRSLLAEVFRTRTRLVVREPDDKEPIAPNVWVAPAGHHLLVERPEPGDERLRFALSVDAAVHYSRPSIDVLFESAARALGPRVGAVILTGANEDGAAGAGSIREAGGLVIVQDPATADFGAMPLAAIREARPQLVADPAAIAACLSTLLGPTPC